MRATGIECLQTHRRARYRTNEQVRAAVDKSTKKRRQRPDVREKERLYSLEEMRARRAIDPESEREKLRKWRRLNPEKYYQQQDRLNERRRIFGR
jgi:hypothetical protein